MSTTQAKQFEDNPFVSVIMPCRNEGKYITKCLDSIVAAQYPREKLEIIVVDGVSTDNTRTIVEQYSAKYAFIKLLANPRRMQTFATNIGLKAARGEVIIRMDAHAVYPANYIPKLVHTLMKSGADCVGGCCVTVPGDNTKIAKAICFALSHPFGVGNSYFRTSVKIPRYVDTVPFGCYRKEVFERIGLFNENLDRTDDIEFNLRLKRSGGKLLLVPDVKSHYYARKNLNELFKQNYGNGFWILYSLKFARVPFSWRHLVPFLFVLSLIFLFFASMVLQPLFYLFFSVVLFYLLVNIYVTFSVSVRYSLTHFIPLALSFATLHLSYGLGSIYGISKLLAEKLSIK